jgi:hypothetical protein
MNRLFCRHLEERVKLLAQLVSLVAAVWAT